MLGELAMHSSVWALSQVMLVVATIVAPPLVPSAVNLLGIFSRIPKLHRFIWGGGWDAREVESSIGTPITNEVIQLNGQVD